MFGITDRTGSFSSHPRRARRQAASRLFRPPSAGGGGAALERRILLAAPPVIDLGPRTPPTYPEQAPPITIAPSGTISDADHPANLKGGSLVVSITNKAAGGDIGKTEIDGTASTHITTDDVTGHVLYKNAVIGTFSYGTHGETTVNGLTDKATLE